MFIQEKLFSNKKLILLTLKEEYFTQIITGKKIHEFRFRFPLDDVTAYIYIPTPVKKVVGKMELQNTRFMSIQKVSDFYHNEYNKPYSEMFDWVTPRKGCYVSDIEDITIFDKSISYEELKRVKGFSAPQQYMYLANKAELLELIINAK